MSSKKPRLTLLEFPAWPSSLRPCPESIRWMTNMRRNGHSPVQIWNRCTNYTWIAWILIHILDMPELAPRCVRSVTPAVQHVFDQHPYPPVLGLHGISYLPEEDQVAYATALKTLTNWRQVRAAALEAGWR